MALYNAFYDRETQSSAVSSLGVTFSRGLERFEYGRKSFPRNANPTVRDGDFCPLPSPHGRYVDRGSRRAETNRVADQIVENLLDLRRIGDHAVGHILALEPDFVFGCLGEHSIGGDVSLDQAFQIQEPPIDRQFAQTD